MNTKSGTQTQTITAADFTMSSTEKKRVFLPYTGKTWGDLLLDIADLVLERVPDEDYDENLVYDFERLVTSFTTEFFFNIQPARVAVTAYINVESPIVGDFRDRVFLRADDDEIKEILDKFFETGAAGLKAKYAEYYGGKYRAWKERAKA